MKKLIPLFAMALAVLGAFVFTTYAEVEEATVTIGSYDGIHYRKALEFRWFCLKHRFISKVKLLITRF